MLSRKAVLRACKTPPAGSTRNAESEWLGFATKELLWWTLVSFAMLDAFFLPLTLRGQWWCAYFVHLEPRSGRGTAYEFDTPEGTRHRVAVIGEKRERALFLS